MNQNIKYVQQPALLVLLPHLHLHLLLLGSRLLKSLLSALGNGRSGSKGLNQSTNACDDPLMSEHA